MAFPPSSDPPPLLDDKEPYKYLLPVSGRVVAPGAALGRSWSTPVHRPIISGDKMRKKPETLHLFPGLDEVYSWLIREAPKDVLVPCPFGKKNPVGLYSGGRWTWNEFDDFLTLDAVDEDGAVKEPGYDWAVLLTELCVIDVDDPALAAKLEEEFPEMKAAPCETTKRGVHYFFRRSALANKCGFYDGCAQVSAHVDFKSLCSTGTPGVLVVSPSTDKLWVRKPWEVPIIDIPDTLLVRVAKPAHVYLSFADESADAAPLPIAVDRVARFHLFNPLSPSETPISVPCTREVFKAMMDVLENGDLPPLRAPTKPFLHSLLRAGTALRLGEGEKRRLLPAAYPGTRFAYRADLYDICEAWWRADAEEEERMVTERSADSALVIVDEELASKMLFVPLATEERKRQDGRWLFQKLPCNRPTHVLRENPRQVLEQETMTPIVAGILRDHANCIILAGGAVLGAAARVPPGTDLDLFIHSTTTEEADTIVTSVRAAAGKAGYVESVSRVAITFSPTAAMAASTAEKHLPFQIILCINRDAAQVIESFDLAPCKVLARYDSSKSQFVIEALPAWVESVRSMAFWVDNSTWGAMSTQRVCKYVARGFEVCVPTSRRLALKDEVVRPDKWKRSLSVSDEPFRDRTIATLFDVDAEYSEYPNRLGEAEVKHLYATTRYVKKNEAPKANATDVETSKMKAPAVFAEDEEDQQDQDAKEKFENYKRLMRREFGGGGSKCKRVFGRFRFPPTRYSTEEGLRIAGKQLKWASVRGVSRYASLSSGSDKLHDSEKLLQIAEAEAEARGK